MTDDDLERVLAVYCDCYEQAGIEPLLLDEAREKMQRFHDLLAPAFEEGTRMH